MRIHNTVGNVEINLNTDRIEGNLREAQKALNMQVAADCEPYIPFQQGALRGSQRYPDGLYGGSIEWDSPYAHYMYEGFVRTDENGRTYVGRGEKKPVLTDRPLIYHQPGTGSQWFETAKEQHHEEWVELVKRKAGEG